MKLLNQKGVSIIQALLISALLAGLALLGTSLLKDQKNTQKGTQTSDDITILHQLVTNILQNKKHCSATLAENLGLLNAGNWKTSGTPVAINRISIEGLSSTTPLVSSEINPATSRPYRYMNQKIEVAGIRINYNAEPLESSRFEIDYRRVGEGVSAKTITKFVPNITFKFENSKDTCYTNSEEANNNVAEQFCTSMGEMFEWNPTTKDCMMKEQTCAPNEVFIGIDSLGKKICRNTADYADWHNLLDTSSSCNPSAPNTNVNLAINGAGKIVIVCTPTGGTTGTTTGCTPINGGWTAWSPATSWGTCTAGVESRTLTRSCTNPTPNTCGAPCPADADGTATSKTETQSCGHCFVDGTACSDAGSLGRAKCSDCCNPPTAPTSECCCSYSVNDFGGACGATYDSCTSLSAPYGVGMFCTMSGGPSWECLATAPTSYPGCCAPTGAMVNSCATECIIPPGWTGPDLCTSPSTLKCAY